MTDGKQKQIPFGKGNKPGGRVSLGFEIQKKKAGCDSLDLLSLGALVHRLDPGIIPFRKARSFDIHVSGGEATARAIPGARLVVVPGMGHDLPEGVWSIVIDAIVANSR